MIRTVSFALGAFAIAALALAQDSDPSDFSDVDAALAALTAQADDTDVAEETDTSADEGADGEDSASEDDSLEEEVTPLIENTWIQSGEAVLRGLDKITGRSTDFSVRVGEPQVFGSLEITLATCFARPPEQAPENAAFLSVASQVPMETQAGIEDDPQLFSGWMFASSPGLNALEHPVYDVWVISCGPGE